MKGNVSLILSRISRFSVSKRRKNVVYFINSRSKTVYWRWAILSAFRYHPFPVLELVGWYKLICCWLSSDLICLQKVKFVIIGRLSPLQETAWNRLAAAWPKWGHQQCSSTGSNHFILPVPVPIQNYCCWFSSFAEWDNCHCWWPTLMK